MSVPAVSVVMAAFDGAAFIAETIGSVLAQTMDDLEIVVVDDCSRDRTAEIVAGIADPRVRLIRSERNGGPAVARTIAMAHARGRFIAGLDQDDLCAPDRLARQLAFLANRPETVLVTSTIAYFGDGAGGRRDPHPTLADPDEIDWTMLIDNPLAWSSALMRGEAARALDPFERDDRRFAEDFDLYHRIRRLGRIGRIAEPLVRYRLHAGGASATYEEGMIRSAGLVLAERYGRLFADPEAAGLLMSRHAAAGYPPADAGVLAACARVLSRLIEAEGHAAPLFARRSAAAAWWRIAGAGLRAGRYDMRALAAARPPFAGMPPPRLARDGAVGAARRIARRSI